MIYGPKLLLVLLLLSLVGRARTEPSLGLEGGGQNPLSQPGTVRTLVQIFADKESCLLNCILLRSQIIFNLYSCSDCSNSILLHVLHLWCERSLIFNSSTALQYFVSIAQKLKKRSLGRISLAAAPECFPREFFLQEGRRAVLPLAKGSQGIFAQLDDRAGMLEAFTTLFKLDS